jgi:hypothetical protein
MHTFVHKLFTLNSNTVDIALSNKIKQGKQISNSPNFTNSIEVLEKNISFKYP